MLDSIKDFLRLESASGLTLIGAAALAMIIANSPLAQYYELLINVPVVVSVGDFGVDKPLLLWVNDGLMAVFFFLVGLEIKREVLDGELNDPRTVALPGFAAVGGIVLPALIYYWFNQNDPVALQGWAIPAATDIAFALAIMAILGPRVPLGLKVFLVTVAIFDDLGAIIIIAVFYTADLSLAALLTASACLPLLLWLNRRGTTELAPYLMLGLVMWVALLKSGVHATVAGVVLAQFIPLRNPQDPGHSPLRNLEHDLHTAVAFGVLPLFAFVNAGLNLTDVSADVLLHPVPLGIAAGLVIGKQLGVFSFAWLALRCGIARLPEGVRLRDLYGAALLCGIGFTMSLFIGSLAFESTKVNLLFDERLGILVGSLLAAILGYGYLRLVLPKPAAKDSAGTQSAPH
ncbi:MAG: Na+/H+ antiporter NhaA [Pseudomonadales bacterium]